MMKLHQQQNEGGSNKKKNGQPEYINGKWDGMINYYDEEKTEPKKNLSIPS